MPPVTLNLIGNFQFLDLAGGPLAPQENLEVTARPGIDGSTLFRLGQRGEPFALTSRVDAYSQAHARWLYSQYRLMAGADPVVAVWHGVDLTSEGYLIAVLAVKPLVVISLANSAGGGLNPPSLGWLECEWQLLAIPIP